METKTYIIMAGVVLVAACSAQGVNKDFYSSGQILPGESWDIVNIYNDDTVVDMLGGSADYISTFDGSTLNVVDGYAEVGAFEYSTINISGAELSGAHAWNYGTVNFYATGQSRALGAGEFGTANMYGGTVEQVGASDSGLLNIYGGLITDCLGASGTSVVNIYGYDFNYDPTGGAYDGGQLTGFWLTGSPFTVDLYGAETYSHINEIPEPGTLALLALGTLLLRRKR
ncbi:MAG TPA: PEP-CTERM sorting domain-containing protein [Sedimentisphaerales bacterium]|nr:PEP-CTERM sorting domain-containing protein [Sedimentisphaerales bacterium]